jgi:hypothetical protein
LTEHPEQLDYQRLAQLHAPEALITWLRLSVLNEALPALIQQINALAKDCHNWSDLEDAITAAIRKI